MLPVRNIAVGGAALACAMIGMVSLTCTCTSLACEGPVRDVTPCHTFVHSAASGWAGTEADLVAWAHSTLLARPADFSALLDDAVS